MPTGRITAAALVLGGALLATLSLQRVAEETAPYILGGVKAEQRYASILGGDVRPGLSRWSRDLFLNDCLTLPRSVYGLLQSPERKLELARVCSAAAESIARESPVNSLAWLVVASAAGQSGDLERLGSAMVEARRTAPDVQWLAARRTSVLDRYVELPERESDDGYLADLRVMLRGPATTELANRYVNDVDLRPLITKAAEGVDAGRQQAFLGAVRQQFALRAN